jgi:hypothetical protein
LRNYSACISEDEVIVIPVSLGKHIRTENAMKIGFSLKEIHINHLIKSQLLVLHLMTQCETHHHHRFWTGVRK